MNLGLRKSDFDIGFSEAFVDFGVELASQPVKAFVGSKLGKSSTGFLSDADK